MTAKLENIAQAIARAFRALARKAKR